MLAFIISNLIGLVRQIVIAHAFGTGSDVEAFNAANRVAEVLFNLTAGGALDAAPIVRGGHRPVELLGEYPSGILPAGRQFERRY
jgi:hypothetical protein